MTSPSSSLRLSASYAFLPQTPSTRVSMILDHFGIDRNQGEHVIAKDLELKCPPETILLFTGESGSGKSSLLRAAANSLKQQGASILSLEEITWEERALIDLLPGSFEENLALLAMCGLGEAQLMLRRPCELSDGQRYRLRLAMGLAQRPDWILADEFAAMLDRRLARVIACNLRRLTRKRNIGFLLATTHDDLVLDIHPETHIHCRLDGEIVVAQSSPPSACGDENVADSASSETVPQKKILHSLMNAGSLPRPDPTGRISLGGITEATRLD